MPSTPYMKLYIGDYLGDTQHLSTLEHGAYMLLIMAYWQNGGPIENDPKLLRRLTRMSPNEFRKCSKNVLKMFQTTDGMLVHKRIDSEIAKREQVSAAARDSASARWCERNANAMPTQCERNATPIVHSPESIDNTNTNTSSRAKSETPEQFEAFWQAYPRKTDKQKAMKKYKALLKAGTSHDIIMARLSVYQSQIASSHTEPQYIKYPASFLNVLDEYIATPSKPEPVEREIECVKVTPEMLALIERSRPKTKEVTHGE